MSVRAKELEFEIVSQIGTISTSESGWSLELNMVSWNGKEPKYDLRPWSPDHTRMGKGITLTESDIIALTAILTEKVDLLK